MKSRVYYSTFSAILTFATFALLAAGLFATYGEPAKFITLAVIITLLLIFAMFYSPLSISADENEVRINSPLKVHSIPMQRIVGIERFQPTMGSVRLCASGGFMGYWGIFREGDVGQYTAFYGKSSDCFMIRLDNGARYVLGCANPDAMVAHIRQHLTAGRDS